MLISCSTCPVRGRRCDDCVVPAFLGLPEVTTPEVEWDLEDHRVLDVLCRSGLVSDRDAVDARLERTTYEWSNVG